MQQGGPQHGAPPPDMSSPVSSHPPAPDEAHAESDEQEAERGPVTGNRWPQAETIVMLKIRSEMDAEFREATLKGPMWEEVSRRLAEQGFRRSGKKCREKFENVQKYYKRTKGHQTGRPDGKSYRFFSQLEALHSNPTAAPLEAITPPPTIHQPTPLSSLPPFPSEPVPASHPGIFSAMSLSYSDSEETEDGGRKRKRSGRMEKTMAFFKGMMREVIDRQEAMQQRFLEALDKRDLQRTTREEWRRQEALRVARRDEAMSQERAAAAGRDAAIMALLQKLARQVEPIAVPVPESHIESGTDQQKELAAEGEDNHPQQVVAVQEPQLEAVLSGSSEVSSSRWPKSEVNALIEIRTSMDNRYQLAGPKGPLWEEISAAMTRQGYNKSAKRCKEKWENINKYFKRVKESSKSRPEDAKTCPYFHQLDALYRSKSLGSGSSTPIPFEVPPPPGQRPLDGSADRVNELGSNGDGSTSEGGQEGISMVEKPYQEPMQFESMHVKITLSVVLKPEDILMELMDGQQFGGHHLWKTKAITGENHNQMREGSIRGAVKEDSANVGKQTMSPYKLELKRLKVSGSSISHMDSPTTEGCSQFLAMTL